MKAPVLLVRQSASLLLLALQSACGGSDATGPEPPAMVAANSATTISGSPGVAVQDRPSVIVRDQNGAPLSGVTVTFAVTSGGGSLTGASQVTNSSGVATVESWTLGSAAGSNTLSASVAALPPVVFTANSTDPCTVRPPHAFGTSANGELTTADCRTANGFYRDIFTTAVPAAGTYAFTQTAAFDAFLILFGSDGFPIAFDDDESATSQNSRIKVFLPAGNYLLGASSFSPSTTGTYTIASATTSSAVTNCEDVFAVRGITTSQVLQTTDCFVNSRYSDDIIVFLRAGQTINLSMTSSAFDAFLELWNESLTRIAFNDDADPSTDNSALTYTATADGFFFVVPTSTVPGATGAYTLSIQ